MKIAVDFDGTCVDHRYPDVGEDVPLAVETMKDLVAEGHQLILYTMRSGDGLKAAEKWFSARKIPLYGVQCDPDQKSWTDSPKCYAHVYVDDCAACMPLLELARFKRPCVNWARIREHFGLDCPDTKTIETEDITDPAKDDK